MADTATPPALARDSAGIPIVENHRPALDSASFWQLSDSPILEIGGEEGDAAKTLYRVTAAVRFSDARLAVADGGSQQIRYFSPSGEHLRSVGGKGSGPGEFNMLTRLFVLPADSLLAYDLMAITATLFDAVGVVVRTIKLSPTDPGGGVVLLARLHDGSFLTEGGTNPMYLNIGTGRKWSSAWVSRLTSNGQSAGNLLEYRGGESIVAGGVAGLGSMGAPFGRSVTPVVAQNRLILASDEHDELRYYDHAGTLRRIARRMRDPRLVTDDEIARYRNDVIRGFRAAANIRELLGIIEFPQTHPAFGQVVADARGNVWLQEYRTRWDTGPVYWSVFDPEGAWVTDIELPDSFRVTDVGTDYVMGVWRDELGVEFVRMYRLVKGAPS